jgi:hypothetical protein
MLAGIQSVILPPGFYTDEKYDKWGNVILPGGMRVRGELFYDESVQKALDPVRHLFTKRVKYPRTWHLPWSPGVTDDDRILDREVVARWKNTDVVITEKMDGENTTMYNDYLHARSIDYSSHPSRDRIKALHAKVGWQIDEGMRVCGENLTAKHSIKYENLPSYFLVFSIWNCGICLSWDDTTTYAGVLGLKMVPVLFRGAYDNAPNRLINDTEKQEGYVVRPSGAFSLREYSTRVGKYVRASHVQTHGHWMRGMLEYNGLMEGIE